MKRLLFVMGFIICTFLFAAASEQGDNEKEDKKEDEQKEEMLTIDRVWSSNEGTEYAIGYALITFKNTTEETFKNQVTIQCTAIGYNGKKINSNERSFFAFERGPIKPGFEGTLKVPVELYGRRMKSMSCAVTTAY